ncbi:hypothetical protein R9X49_04590 [Pectobacterium carotovorum]|uniref:hypothetical protein n=1 Tax=Pectobacterium carotovorum TaxID=554 RepID=UPI0029DACE3B|nr:hypothetical protein [Pectobacterium carotovorum]MDX6914377.1 hypothetical protein [Pectobacterium carotovorum]
MANLSENPQWVDGIYQIETSDPVVGGPDGVSNRQAKELASRTSYLKKEQEKTGSDLATHAAAADPHTQYAPKASPTFTGTPKAPTPATDSNSQQVATTAFVKSVSATKLAKDQNGADILDRELFNRNLGSSRAYSSSIPIGGSAGLWTTAEFIGWLESQGAFVHAYWVCRGSWSYSHNKIISDTGCGQIPLAGSVVEVMGQNDATTIRVTTPSTTPAGLNDSANAQFTYVYNGVDYSPGWRRDYNTKNKPTAADVGALPEKAVAQAAVKLATPRTINGVLFDGTANIALTAENLGLGETVNLAAGALEKAKNGADISDKIAFYSNVSLRGTLGNGMTFANCDKSGDYVVMITDPNTVSDMPTYKGQKLYGYGVLHVSRRDNFVGQEYINHSGDYAWRQKWDDGVYAPWVIALSSSRVPTATDVGAYTKAETDTHVTAAITTANNAATEAASANANANSRVPSVRKVNGKTLTADIMLTADDVGAMPANSSGTRIWISGEYPPVASTPLVVTHGLANINPLHCRCDVLVKCIVAEGEYRVGDFAINPMTLFIQNSVGHPYSLLPALNTSTIQLNMMHHLVASFKTSTIGNQQLNMSNWRFIFRIFY